MKNILQFLFPLLRISLVISLLMALPAEAQEKKWRGFLIDRMCMKAIDASPDPQDFVQHHTKDCVLMPACRKAGFVLFMEKEKKWLFLDKKGNENAEQVIRESKRTSAFYVSVAGKLAKDTIQVEAIHEIPLNAKESAAINKDEQDGESP